MGLMDHLKEWRNDVKNHYRGLKEAIFSKGLMNIIKNLDRIYFPKKKPKLRWIFFDFIILVLLLCLFIDLSYFAIGKTIGPIGIDNTMLIEEEGYFLLNDVNILSQEYYYWIDGKQLKDIELCWTFHPEKESSRYGYKCEFKKDHNLSKHNLQYFIHIGKIFYSEEEFDKRNKDKKLSNIGDKTLKKIIVVGSLINCSKEADRYSVIVEKCTAYPLTLTPGVGFLAPNREFKLELGNLSFDYTLRGEHVEIGNIKLHYRISKRVDRPMLYLTKTYPTAVLKLIAPSIIGFTDWLKSTFKTDFFVINQK